MATIATITADDWIAKRHHCSDTTRLVSVSADLKVMAAVSVALLTGTDKQIAWAQDLRKAYITTMLGKVANNAADPRAVVMIEKLETGLMAEPLRSAKWWIDHRAALPQALASYCQ